MVSNENYESYVNEVRITLLPKAEMHKYEGYHRENYQEDQRISKFLTQQSPKWAIIAGYYAMHNLTKLFLAKCNLKIGDRAAHTATIIALRKHIQDEKMREQVLTLLHKAQEAYDVLNSPLKEKILAVMLSSSLEERNKAQYYSEDFKKVMLRHAMYFQENIILPYIEIMQELTLH